MTRGKNDSWTCKDCDGDWWCPECVANHPGPGACVRCDITLVHGHPDKAQS